MDDDDDTTFDDPFAIVRHYAAALPIEAAQFHPPPANAPALTPEEIQQLKEVGEYSGGRPGDLPYPRRTQPTHVCSEETPLYAGSYIPRITDPDQIIAIGTEMIAVNEAIGQARHPARNNETEGADDDLSDLTRAGAARRLLRGDSRVDCAYSQVIIEGVSDNNQRKRYIPNNKITKKENQLPSLMIKCATPRDGDDTPAATIPPAWSLKKTNEPYLDTFQGARCVVVEGTPAQYPEVSDCIVEASFRGATLILRSLRKRSDKSYVLSLMKDKFISFQVGDWSQSTRAHGPFRVLVQFSNKYVFSLEDPPLTQTDSRAADIVHYKLFQLRTVFGIFAGAASTIESYEQQVEDFKHEGGAVKGFNPARDSHHISAFQDSLQNILNRNNIDYFLQDGTLELGWNGNYELTLLTVNNDAGTHSFKSDKDFSSLRSARFSPTIMHYIEFSPEIAGENSAQVPWLDFMATYCPDGVAYFADPEEEEPLIWWTETTETVEGLREEIDRTPVKTLKNLKAINAKLDSRTLRENIHDSALRADEDLETVERGLENILQGINSVEDSYDLLLNRTSIGPLLTEALSCLIKQVPSAEGAIDWSSEKVAQAKGHLTTGAQYVGAARDVLGEIPPPDEDFTTITPALPNVPTLNFPDNLPTRDLLEDYTNSITEGILESLKGVFVDAIKNIIENVLAACNAISDTQAGDSLPLDEDQIERVGDYLSTKGLTGDNIDLSLLFDDVSSMLTSKEVCSLFSGTASVHTINLVISLINRRHQQIASTLGSNYGSLRAGTIDFFKSIGTLLGTASFCRDLEPFHPPSDPCVETSEMHRLRQSMLQNKCVLTDEEIDQQLEREKNRKLELAKKISELLLNGLTSGIVPPLCSSGSPGVVPSSHHTFDFMMGETVENLFSGVYSSFSSDIKEYNPLMVTTVEKFKEKDGEQELQSIIKRSLPAFYDTIERLEVSPPALTYYQDVGYGVSMRVEPYYNETPTFAMGAVFHIDTDTEFMTSPESSWNVGYILEPATDTPTIENNIYKIFMTQDDTPSFQMAVTSSLSPLAASYIEDEIMDGDYLFNEKDSLSLEQYSFGKLVLNSMISHEALKDTANSNEIKRLFAYGGYSEVSKQIFASMLNRVKKSPLFSGFTVPYNGASPEEILKDNPLLIEYLDLSSISSASCKADHVLFNMDDVKNSAKASFCEAAPSNDPDDLFSPFDRALLETVVDATIRLYVFDYFLRSFFVFSTIYSTPSQDEALAKFYAIKMVGDLQNMGSSYYSRFYSFLADGLEDGAEDENTVDDLLIPKIKEHLAGIRRHVAAIIKFDTAKEINEAFLTDMLPLLDAPTFDSDGYVKPRRFDRLAAFNFGDTITRLSTEINQILVKVLSLWSGSVAHPPAASRQVDTQVTRLITGGWIDPSKTTQRLLATVAATEARRVYLLAVAGSALGATRWDPETETTVPVWPITTLTRTETEETLDELRRSFERLAFMTASMAASRAAVEERFREPLRNATIVADDAPSGLTSPWAPSTDAVEEARAAVREVVRLEREKQAALDALSESLIKPHFYPTINDIKDGGLFLEKFIRVEDWLPTDDEYRSLPDEIKDRDSSLRGVLSLDAFKDLVVLWQATCSPWCGRAPFKEISYGLRMIFMPPSIDIRDVPYPGPFNNANFDGEIEYLPLQTQDSPILLDTPDEDPKPPVIIDPIYIHNLNDDLKDDSDDVDVYRLGPSRLADVALREKAYKIVERRPGRTVSTEEGDVTIYNGVALHPIPILEVSRVESGSLERRRTTTAGDEATARAEREYHGEGYDQLIARREEIWDTLRSAGLSDSQIELRIWTITSPGSGTWDWEAAGQEEQFRLVNELIQIDADLATVKESYDAAILAADAMPDLTPAILLSSDPHAAYSSHLPSLYTKMMSSSAYKLLTEFVFPLGLYESMANIINFINSTQTPGVEQMFLTTRDQVKYAFDAVSSKNGNFDYQYKDSSIAAAGGSVGINEKGRDLTGLLEDTGAQAIEDLKGIGIGFITKALISAPLQIIKGQAELVDPNIRISKRIQRKVKRRIDKNVPIASISLPLSFFMPLTPFGLAYIGLGLGGFKSSSKPTRDGGKTEVQKEIENRGVTIMPPSCGTSTEE